MKKVIKRITVLLTALALTACFAISPMAESTQYVPYESYTYWENISGGGRKSVYNRPMFEPSSIIDAQTIGVESFTEITDICTDGRGNIYILDSKSRIVVLDSNYKLKREIKSVKGKENYTFEGAKNIFIHQNETVFISDTEQKRVLVCDLKGNYKDVYTLPDSPLIPENFDFKPVKTVADSKGYVYVLSNGSYYGALLYAPDKSFIGFYGSNTVVNGILGAAKSLIQRMFPNNAKKSGSQRLLPFVFSDIAVDNRDFIYTATDSLQKAQIKKLSPGTGDDILHSDTVNFTDDEVNRTYLNGKDFKQAISGIDVDDQGMIYCLDSTYGRIYLYDPDCRMVTAFGGGMGAGSQKGSFLTANALTIHNDNILVSDKTNNTVTVFARTSYGSKVLDLIAMTGEGNYIEAKAGWEEVLKLDKNFQLAHSGIALAHLAEGDYDAAMVSAYEGYDRETYSLAFEYYRNDWISDNFGWIFTLAIFLIAGIITAAVIISKKKIRIVKNAELALMLKTPIHPGNVFADIKEKGKGSVLLGVVLLLLFYVSTVAKTILGGFMFTSYDPGSFNALWVFVKSVGLVVLWITANWLVCTLLSGKGKVREIFIVTCYSLIPLIVCNLLWTAISNALLQTEASFLGILSTVAMLYALLIFVIGMLRIHDFTMSRFLGTSLLTVIGMAAIVFLLILVGILLQQLGGFIATLFIEMIM